MKVLGITGPTGAGKTTALHALEELGVWIIDADELYHGLLEREAALKEALTAAFGMEILDAAGRVDRRRLAGAVYPDRLGELNALTHPFILAAIDTGLERAEEQGYQAAAIDAIALIESGLAARCDAVVAVLAPAELRIRRVMARDGIDAGYARRRVEAQPSDSFYRAHSDYVLENGAGDVPAAFAARAGALFREVLGVA